MGSEELTQLDGILHPLRRHHYARVLGMPQRMQNQRETGNMGWQLRVEPGGQSVCLTDERLVLVEPGNIEPAPLRAQVDPDPDSDRTTIEICRWEGVKRPVDRQNVGVAAGGDRVVDPRPRLDIRNDGQQPFDEAVTLLRLVV